MKSTYVFVSSMTNKGKITSANGVEYVLLKDYDILKNENNQLKHDLSETYNQLIETEKEAQAKISELESELETKDNLLKIKNGLCGSFGCLPSEPISVANMLINAKEEYEPSSLQKALTGTKEKCLIDKYSDDDLEQIAEYLLVYCRHNREDDE